MSRNQPSTRTGRSAAPSTAAESTSQIDWRLELIQVPVSDIDRAKAFYVEKAGFVAEHDHQVSEELRFVQLTPPGSHCSIALTRPTLFLARWAAA
jgi:hypothetical protein